MEWLWWLVLPGALLGGLLLFALFAMLVTGTTAQLGRAERLSQMESDHYNRSQAETQDLLTCLYAGDMERYEERKAIYQKAWNSRVKEIVELAVPVDDETMEELEAGINPYR